MKKFLVLLCIVYCALCIKLGAVPAKPVVKDSVLADGSVVQMVLRGDEYGHYYEELGVRSEELGANNILQIAERRERAMAKRRNSQLSTFNSKRAPHQAERGLVILVEFSDNSFKKTRQNFYDLLNKEDYNYNGAIGSARDYFSDASNGQYAPQFDVYGPYKLDKKMSYYGQNDREGLDMHPDQMVVDAVAKLNAAENIDFTDYDTDNDGRIDNIFIYYAGYGENEGASENTIWPHAWEVYDEYVTGELEYDGKRIGGYACTSELQGVSGSVMCGIGTFCHEFSHVLGLPDFYVTDYSSSHKTLGDWDIMDSGAYLNDGNTPPTYSAHERFYLGWLTPEILNGKGDYELRELQESNKAYIITATGEHNLDGGNPSPKTYYLLENRQQTIWDAYLPGHGLMITKTVYDEDAWYNNVPNNSRYSQGYDLIEADGKTPNDNYGKAGDLFPGTAKVTNYTPFARYPITNIKESNGVISFTFMDGVSTEKPDTGDVVMGDCWEETFDDLTEAGSVDISSDMDVYADNEGWDGYKLFCASGALKVGSSKHKGYVITPELFFEGDVVVEFVGKGYNSDDEISFEIDGGVVASVDVASQWITATFKLNDFVKNTSIKIYAATNRFYIDRLKVCVEQQAVFTTPENESEVCLVTNDGVCQLLNLSGDARVSCYDLVGRLMWSVDATDSFEFEQPQGFYLIRVEEKDKEVTLKGL